MVADSGRKLRYHQACAPAGAVEVHDMDDALWVVDSGGTLIGPFDGLAPAMQLRQQLSALGVTSTARHLFAPSEALQAAGVRAADPKALAAVRAALEQAR